MGKKLDALLGRSFKTSKFKPQVNLAISRLVVLKNQRQIKYSQARSDVVQLLELGHHERALLRVEQVIKEQNMLDVFAMIEGYCHLLLERIQLIQQDKVCPDELKEAVSSLLFAASRVGDFPELREIRVVFTSRYGKEFAARSIELRNNCGVNPKMVQKLSTRHPGLENKIKVLKEIAAEKDIVLHLQEDPSASNEDKLDTSMEVDKPSHSGVPKLGNEMKMIPEEMGTDDAVSDSFRARKKYKDVADAAQAAFESAAYAAAAARAAVELSRSGSHDPDDHNSPHCQRRKPSEELEVKKPESESENEEILDGDQVEESVQSNNMADSKRSISASSTDSAEDNLVVPVMSFNEEDPAKLLEKDIVFDESDDDILKSEHKVETEIGHSTTDAAEGSQIHSTAHFKAEKGPISVRTRGVRGY